MSLAGQKDDLQEACLYLPAEISVVHQPHHRTQNKMLKNPGLHELLGSGEEVMDVLEGSFIPYYNLRLYTWEGVWPDPRGSHPPFP